MKLRQNNIELIDASCPVVLDTEEDQKKYELESTMEFIVIYGERTRRGERIDGSTRESAISH